MQQDTDGHIRYRVLTLGEEGRRLYEVDDQGDYQVTLLPSTGRGNLESYRSHPLPQHTAEQAMQDLFDASLVSSREVKKRSDLERTRADASALQLLANGPLEPGLLVATSLEDVDSAFNDYKQPRVVPFDVLFMRP